MVAFLNRQMIACIDARQAHIAGEDGDADVAHVGHNLVDALRRRDTVVLMMAKEGSQKFDMVMEIYRVEGICNFFQSTDTFADG